MPNPSYLINDLEDKLKIKKEEINQHINKLKTDDKLKSTLKKERLAAEESDFITTLFEKHLLSKDKETLSCILARKLTESISEKQIFLQLTKRTKYKQQQLLENLKQLPNYIQEQYNKAADKLLNWINYKFINQQVSKIIIDISPGGTIENNEIDLRITYYEENRPADLNLIFKSEPDHLKKLTWPELRDHLKCIERLNSDFSDVMASPDKFLENLAQFLSSIDKTEDNSKLIKKFFKRITVSPSYYEVIIEPEILIVDFSKINLPSALEADYKAQEEVLYLNFDNQFHLKCEMEETKDNSNFIVKFKDIPTDLNLISFIEKEE